mmetsp:Transcript_21818/g.55829  ORF Transcript_21818/g.55829 Transcript_21818/m.55829 type:complete len:333 (-) Transcript_21818:103-1101(-)
MLGGPGLVLLAKRTAVPHAEAVRVRGGIDHMLQHRAGAVISTLAVHNDARLPFASSGSKYVACGASVGRAEYKCIAAARQRAPGTTTGATTCSASAAHIQQRSTVVEAEPHAAVEHSCQLWVEEAAIRASTGVRPGVPQRIATIGCIRGAERRPHQRKRRVRQLTPCRARHVRRALRGARRRVVVAQCELRQPPLLPPRRRGCPRHHRTVCWETGPRRDELADARGKRRAGSTHEGIGVREEVEVLHGGAQGEGSVLVPAALAALLAPPRLEIMTCARSLPASYENTSLCLDQRLENLVRCRSVRSEEHCAACGGTWIPTAATTDAATTVQE